MTVDTDLEPVEAPSPDASEQPASRASRATAPLIVVSILLLAGLVVLLVFLALALGKASDADAKQKASRDATNAAARDLPMFGSYGYATIAADQKRAESVFVPALRANYEKLFNPVLQTLQQNKVIVTVTPQQAQATQVTSKTQVQVLIFFTQTTSTPSASAPTVKAFAYALQMQKVNGTWLVAAVNPPS